jgi:hypothetical protein
VASHIRIEPGHVVEGVSLLPVLVASLRAEVRHVAARLSLPDATRGQYGVARCGATPVFTQERITTAVITDLPACPGCYSTGYLP